MWVHRNKTNKIKINSFIIEVTEVVIYNDCN